MREGSVSDLVGDGVDDNVIALPDLMHGRLAELLQAAGGPALDHELRGETAARAAFQSAAQSWPLIDVAVKGYVIPRPGVLER